MIDSSRVCRSCLREGEEMRELFLDCNDRSQGLRLDVMLISSAQVQIAKNDGLPKQICLTCTDRLLNAFMFKKMCQESDSALKKLQRENDLNLSNDPGNVKQESSSLIDFITLTTQVLPIKVESRENIHSLLWSNTEKLDSNEKCTQTNDHFIECHNCPVCQKKFKSLVALSKHFKKHIDLSSTIPISNKIEQVEEQPDLLNKSNNGFAKTHVDKKFHCIPCNKCFKSKINFEQHQQSHNKRKIYNCKKCSEIFNSASLREKHICQTVKNKCPTCYETFVTSIELNQHIKEIHSEESKHPVCNEMTKIENIVDKSSDLMTSHPINIKEEPLEDISVNGERENQILSDNVTDDYLDMDDLGLKELINDPAFTSSNFKKKDPRIRKSIKVKKRKMFEDAVNNFVCDVCQKDFSSKIELKEHQTNEHNPEDFICVCQFCNETFDEKRLLKKHLISHDVKQFECETCNKSFFREDHLKKHMWQHMVTKPFQCDICPRGFIKQQHLERHKYALHSGKEKNPKVAFCKICCRGFTTEKYLETHMRMHTGDKTFTCDVCDKSFNSKWHLKEHSRWHSAEKPFLCSECGQRFIRNDYLVVHMRRHSGDKPYKCKYCDKGFPRSTDLIVHQRYHTGEKTHLCTVCGKGFQRQYNLKVHLRVHTGERPYICSYCGKKFAQSNDLKSHVRRHTGERFNCELCGEGFIQGYHLTQHKRTVHGVDNTSNVRRLEKHPEYLKGANQILKAV